MNLREAREFVEQSYCVDATIQQQPYTAVQISVFVTPDHGIPFSSATKAVVGKGFSKVSWPDEWDEAKGIEYAMKRAKRNLVRRLVAQQ